MTPNRPYSSSSSTSRENSSGLRGLSASTPCSPASGPQRPHHHPSLPIGRRSERCLRRSLWSCWRPRRALASASAPAAPAPSIRSRHHLNDRFVCFGNIRTSNCGSRSTCCRAFMLPCFAWCLLGFQGRGTLAKFRKKK